MDSDDYIRNDYLECFVDIYCKTKCDIIIADLLHVGKIETFYSNNFYTCFIYLVIYYGLIYDHDVHS